MNGIGRQAAFYRGYLPDERSVIPLTVLLSTTVALWLLVYLVGAVADARQGGGAARVASVSFIGDRSAENPLIGRDARRPRFTLLFDVGEPRPHHAAR